MVVVNHEHLDGIETYNAHPWHNSRNYLAELAYREQRKKHPEGRPFIATVGSDCHELTHEGSAGILTDVLPRSGAELATLLREQKYEIYIKG
jgi:hypothetical protein